MRNFRALVPALFLVATVFSAGVRAEPTGVSTTLVNLRPYIGGTTGSMVYVYPADTSPCNTNIYTIDLTSPAGKAAYAAALSAMMAGKHVMLEAVSCTGLYTALQSVYVMPN